MIDALVDWDVAARTAKRVSPTPPRVSRAAADEVVGDLYRATSAAAGHVAELTKLQEPPISAVTRVVDRAAWVEVNAGGMRTVLTPLLDRVAAQNSSVLGAAGQGATEFAARVGSRAAGAQLGVLLGFLSGRVLGQFEFFDRPGGQLMLVAPNIVSVEQHLQVAPADFRLWVCLHEVTHRVQFTAVPWLRQHMLAELNALTDAIETDPAVLRTRVSTALGEIVKVIRGQDVGGSPGGEGVADGGGAGLMAVLASPEQRLILDRVAAFMSLIEGHAEYVMNAVPKTVIPTQHAIEQRFAARRKGGNPLDRLLRRLLGLDAKTRQYVDGSAFVRAVVDRVGVTDFNAIWTSRDTLPTKDEIADPLRWIARVHA
ncbi:MAG TPA: zinc-dependent metalloprotease [Jatrophihabitans sp.]